MWAEVVCLLFDWLFDIKMMCNLKLADMRMQTMCFHEHLDSWNKIFIEIHDNILRKTFNSNIFILKVSSRANLSIKSFDCSSSQ